MRLYSFKQLLYHSQSLRQAVGILFITVLISNVLGLLRNVIIANRAGVTYGTIGSLDSYYAAFTIPDLLYTLLIVGALSSAILPMLVQLDSQGDEKEFWNTYNTLLSTGIAIVALGVVLLYFLLPYLIPIVFSGFSAEEIKRTASLSQVLLLSPLFFTLSQISSSALQAKRRFFAPALAPIIYNLAIISGAILIPEFGLSVLVFGVVVGAAAHFLVQLPSLLKLGWRFEFTLGFNNERIRRILRLMIPRTIALTSTQLMLLAFYQIASHLKEGSIAIYRLTDDLQTAPVLLFANTLAMAVLPEFARKFAQSEKEELIDLVGKTARLLIYLFAPMMAFLIVFRFEIVSLYIALGHSISEAEITLAAQTLSYFVVSLVFQAMVLVLARAYFAQNNTLKPTMFTLVSLLISWLVAIYLTKTTSLGVAGLAMAFSIGSTLNALLLWLGLGAPLRSFIKSPDGRQNLIHISVGAGIALIGFQFGKLAAPFVSQHLIIGQSLTKLIDVFCGLVIGFGFYFVWSKIMSIEQWQLITNRKNSTKS